MKAIDVLILALIVLILGSAVFFLRRAKKKGVKCIGCPDSSTCSGNCGNCSGSCDSCAKK